MIVNRTGLVTGFVADANNYPVEGQTISFGVTSGAAFPAQDASGGDGRFTDGLTAPVAATYTVTATLQSDPSVIGNVDVPVHPELYIVVSSLGVVAGGQNVSLEGDGFANPSGTAAFFNSTTSKVQTDALKSIQAVTPPSPLGGFGDGIVDVSANSPGISDNADCGKSYRRWPGDRTLDRHRCGRPRQPCGGAEWPERP